MSDFIAAFLMILVFAGTWATLFYVGGSSWLKEASVLRAKHRHSGDATGFASAPSAAAQLRVAQARGPVQVARLLPA